MHCRCLSTFFNGPHPSSPPAFGLLLESWSRAVDRTPSPPKRYQSFCHACKRLLRVKRGNKVSPIPHRPKERVCTQRAEFFSFQINKNDEPNAFLRLSKVSIKLYFFLCFFLLVRCCLYFVDSYVHLRVGGAMSHFSRSPGKAHRLA